MTRRALPWTMYTPRVARPVEQVLPPARNPWALYRPTTLARLRLFNRATAAADALAAGAAGMSDDAFRAAVDGWGRKFRAVGAWDTASAETLWAARERARTRLVRREEER